MYTVVLWWNGGYDTDVIATVDTLDKAIDIANTYDFYGGDSFGDEGIDILKNGNKIA